MKRQKIVYSIALLTTLITGFASCRPDDIVGGKGGKAILRVTPQHHSKNVDSCTIYIKYNTKDIATVYDDSAKCVNDNGIPVATFTELKKGDYYIAARGWDKSIAQAVNGGGPYTITEETTFTYNVAVTEKH